MRQRKTTCYTAVAECDRQTILDDDEEQKTEEWKEEEQLEDVVATAAEEGTKFGNVSRAFPRQTVLLLS